MKELQNDTLSARLDSLKAGREEYLRKIACGEIKRLTPLEKAKENPTSLRAAVNAKCWDCNGGENWIHRTKFCQISDCGLWAVRKGGSKVSIEECLETEIA